MPPAERWVLPGGEIHVRRHGSTDPHAPAVVLVHGLGGSALNWVSLMRAWGEEVTCLAVDLPGFGASPPRRDGDYSPRGHARAVAESIDEWALQRGVGIPVHVVGNSLGGAVSVHLAARRPDLVRSLTLVSPALPSYTVGRGNAHLPVVAVPGVGESLVRRYAAVPAAQRVQATFDACTADPGRIDADVRAAIVEETMRRDGLPYARDAFLSSLRGLLATFADAGPGRPWRLARQVRQPVLAIYGEQDILVSPRGASRAAREFPDAEVALVADCGHVAQMEHPALVAQMWRTRFARAGLGAAGAHATPA